MPGAHNFRPSRLLHLRKLNALALLSVPLLLGALTGEALQARRAHRLPVRLHLAKRSTTFPVWFSHVPSAAQIVFAAARSKVLA